MGRSKNILIRLVNIDFNKLKLEFGWQSIVIIFGLLTTTITFVVKNNQLNESLKSLKEDVKSLNTTVMTLKGSQDITNSAINQMMQYPAGELRYRIESLEKALEKQGGYKVYSDNRR
jgi:hypothetical protein